MVPPQPVFRPGTNYHQIIQHVVNIGKYLDFRMVSKTPALSAILIISYEFKVEFLWKADFGGKNETDYYL